MTGRSRHLLWLTWLPLLTLCGCADSEPLTTTYGKRAGMGEVSVNGTAVLSRMFAAKGYRVTSSRFLGHAVRTADVVVWCPNTFELPTERVCQFFEAWLAERPARTLVLIGRDYDGAVDYWEQLVATERAPAEVARLRQQLAMRRSEVDLQRQAAVRGAPPECPWFTQVPVTPFDARQLGGRWSDPPVTVTLQVQSALESDAAGFQPLMTAEGKILTAQLTKTHWQGGQIVITQGGGWLLNMGLVHPGHRDLAQRLIDVCGAPQAAAYPSAVFLESDTNAPHETQGTERPYWLEAFTVWPFNSILIHATVVGMVLCLAIFPIFGRPREDRVDGQSDFGRHVQAIGRLTAATGDEARARELRHAYWTMVKKKQLPDDPLATTTGMPSEIDLASTAAEPRSTTSQDHQP